MGRARNKHTVRVQAHLLQLPPYLCLEHQPPRPGDGGPPGDQALHQLVMQAASGERDASTGWAIAWERHLLQTSAPARTLGPPRGYPPADGPATPRAAFAAFCASAQGPPGALTASFMSTAFYGLWTSFVGVEFEDRPGIYVRGEEHEDLDTAERLAAAAALESFSSPAAV